MQADDIPCEFVNRSKHRRCCLQQTPSLPPSANVVAVAFQNFRVSRSREGHVSLEGILGVEKFRKNSRELAVSGS
ncbi:hypothetical protein P8452_62832 [Trifolium repens]|nr:hypothetical protein P8452_62832 [Trifolium repens]